MADKIALADLGLQIRVLIRPIDSELAAPNDQFVKVMSNWKKHKSLRECCQHSKPNPIPRDDPQAVLDRMLLVLWDALHLEQCLLWSKTNVANLPVNHCLEVGRWFGNGLAVSVDPIFTGMCAMCLGLGCNCNHLDVRTKCRRTPLRCQFVVRLQFRRCGQF